MMGTSSNPYGIPWGCVDVRDVAEAHLKAVLVDEAKGNRFILHKGVLSE